MQSAGSATIAVNRTGGSTGAVSVAYSTSDGTAIAGKNYTAKSGTLSWSAGDTSAKSIVVPISAATVLSSTTSFGVSLSKPTSSASLGSPAKATVAITPSATAANAGSVGFSVSAYTVAQSAGSVTLTVNRTGGTNGAVAVNYATSNGTASAGMNYTAESGTLSWAAGDAAGKSVSVPVSSTVISGAVTFSVALSQPTGGASLSSFAKATVAVNPNPNSSLSIAVSGNHLVDGNGNTVQLRGVNVAGLEGVAIQGWDPTNPWGGSSGTTTPDWALMKTWGVNAVRLPINEASWNGGNCVDVGGYGVHFVNGVKTNNTPGESVSADPGGNYKATVATTVAQATAAGLYVILDLHLAAPSNVCPNIQNPMADADNSIKFWSSFASAFKSYPNVIFELFNEPFLDQVTVTGTTAWPALINGGTLTSYKAQTLTNPWYTTVQYTWQTAGMQAMLDAVRATGATNVILTSTLAYSSAVGGWLQYHPTDTLKPSQIGAVWHAYPSSANPSQVNCVGTNCSPQILSDAQAILAAGYPIVVTEFGDPSGGATAPWSSVLLPFADTNGISYMGWTWNPWVGTTFYLISDGNGDPTVGYGAYVKAHYQCRAAGTAKCL
jgi:endoglucanase